MIWSGMGQLIGHGVNAALNVPPAAPGPVVPTSARQTSVPTPLVHYPDRVRMARIDAEWGAHV